MTAPVVAWILICLISEQEELVDGDFVGDTLDAHGIFGSVT
jgi:hypothetical protein